MWAQALLLLIVIGFTGAAALIAVLAALRGNQRMFRYGAGGAALVASAYTLVLVVVSAALSDKNLRLGEEKYICELDCHLAYSVAAVRRIGDSLIVRINVRFDKESISGRRALNAPLYPGSRFVQLRDNQGQVHRSISLGDLGRTLLPGASYQTELIFDVDQTATGLILYIADADPTKMILVGSDNSLFRRPAGFRL